MQSEGRLRQNSNTSNRTGSQALSSTEKEDEASLLSSSEDEKIVVRFLVDNFNELVRGNQPGSARNGRIEADSRSEVAQNIKLCDGPQERQTTVVPPPFTPVTNADDLMSAASLQSEAHVQPSDSNLSKEGSWKSDTQTEDKGMEVSSRDALIMALRQNYKKARESAEGTTNLPVERLASPLPVRECEQLDHSNSKTDYKASPNPQVQGNCARRAFCQLQHQQSNHETQHVMASSPAFSSLSALLTNPSMARPQADMPQAENNSLSIRLLGEVLSKVHDERQVAAAARADFVETIAKSAALAMAFNTTSTLWNSLNGSNTSSVTPWYSSATLLPQHLQHPSTGSGSTAGAQMQDRSSLPTLSIWANLVNTSWSIPGLSAHDDSRKRKYGGICSSENAPNNNFMAPASSHARQVHQSSLVSNNSGIDSGGRPGTLSRKRSKSGSQIDVNSTVGTGQSLPYSTLSESLKDSTSTTPSLYSPSDDFCLSRFQCLARQQIEIFKATKDDVEAGARGRNNPIGMGQVGIRCKHCASAPRDERTRGSTYFPTKFERVYQTGVNMAAIHLCQHCLYVPQSVRDELNRLKREKSVAGGGKQYWGEAIKKFGIIETEEQGLRMLNSSPLWSQTTTTSSSS